MKIDEIEKNFKIHLKMYPKEATGFIEEYFQRLLKVARSVSEYNGHPCGLEAWVGECKICNNLTNAMKELEK